MTAWSKGTVQAPVVQSWIKRYPTDESLFSR